MAAESKEPERAGASTAHLGSGSSRAWLSSHLLYLHWLLGSNSAILTNLGEKKIRLKYSFRQHYSGIYNINGIGHDVNVVG